MSVIQCRLCDGQSDFKFELLLLGKHSVKYYHCASCGALQTELPYWLEEAYRNIDLLDTGRATRTLVNFLVLPKLFEFLDVAKSSASVDFGGGSGLFARLMRDVGYDYHTCDKYGTSEFAAGFVWSDLCKKVNVVSLFEVAEQTPLVSLLVLDSQSYSQTQTGAHSHLPRAPCQPKAPKLTHRD